MGKLKIFDCYSKELLSAMKNASIELADPNCYLKVKEKGKMTKDRALLNRAVNGMLDIVKYCEAHPTCEGCSFRKEHIGCEFRGKSPREWNND